MILGAVLAGGASSRFGSDKALHHWRGRPLVEHALAALAPHSDALVVAGREATAGLSVPCLPDHPRPRLGPLGGLAAALRHARLHGFARVLTAGCDTPRIPAGLLQTLVARPGSAILVALPVIAIWEADHADLLDRFLAEAAESRARSIRAFAEAAGAARLDLPAPPNINRPEDADALEGPC